MGALCYAPAPTNIPTHGTPTIAWFEDLIPRVEDNASIEDLRRLRAATGGSQGARPKFVAQMHNAQRVLRDHRCAHDPHWVDVLIKARGKQDRHDAVAIECAYGAMMQQANIQTSPMFVLEGAQKTFFVTHRFDRDNGKRLHMATVAGLLDAPLTHGALDYTDILGITQFLCRDHQAVEEMYKRMVFNARTHARDDHMRNRTYYLDKPVERSISPAWHHTERPARNENKAKLQQLCRCPLSTRCFPTRTPRGRGSRRRGGRMGLCVRDAARWAGHRGWPGRGCGNAADRAAASSRSHPGHRCTAAICRSWCGHRPST